MWSGTLKGRAYAIKKVKWCSRIVASMNICELLMPIWANHANLMLGQNWLVPRPSRWAARLRDIVAQIIVLIMRDGARNRPGEDLGKRMVGRWRPDFYCEEIIGRILQKQNFSSEAQHLTPLLGPLCLIIPVFRTHWWQEAKPHSNDLRWKMVYLKNIGQSHQT